jgi:hypothetical protein
MKLLPPSNIINLRLEENGVCGPGLLIWRHMFDNVY